MKNTRSQKVLEAVRQSRVHEVKSWPHLFEATLNGTKKHDMRRASDRDYNVGDFLLLKEFDPKKGTYTGRQLRAKITYITSAEFPCALSAQGLSEGYCILSLELQSE
ncbi:DUF3850 domain-containing protein [Methylobacterium sp. MA0201]|nr:DUF3850 domain-containing protein [Methylobacterium sp. DB0501]